MHPVVWLLAVGSFFFFSFRYLTFGFVPRPAEMYPHLPIGSVDLISRQ